MARRTRRTAGPRRDRASRLSRNPSLVESRTFNVVGSRPRAQPVLGDNVIAAMLSYSAGTSLTTSASVPTFGGQAFTIASFDNSSQYLSLFDQYKFVQLECWIEPLEPQGSTSFGSIYSAVDFDDSNVPSNPSNVGDHQNSLISGGGAAHYHRFRPHVAMATFGSGAFSSYSNVPAGWVDSASPNTAHFGLKIAADPTPSITHWTLYVRALVHFRQPGL